MDIEDKDDYFGAGLVVISAVLVTVTFIIVIFGPLFK